MDKTINNYINQLHLDPKKEAAVRKIVELAGGSGGYCIPIVDSEDKLESLGLAQGQIAAVAKDFNGVTSFRNLYISSVPEITINKIPSDIDCYSRVKKLEFQVPIGLNPGDGAAVGIMSIDAFEDSKKGESYSLIVADMGQGNIIVGAQRLGGQGEKYIFIENGTIYQDVIDSFNQKLINGNFVYVGPYSPEMNFDILDSGVKVLSDVRYGKLYIKNGNFTNIADGYDIEGLKRTAVNSYIPLYKRESEESDKSKNYSFDILSGYNLVKLKDGGHIYIKYSFNDNYLVSEDIVEIHCYEKNIINIEGDIVWENNTPPAFEPNTIVRVSIINGLATYKVFPMST